MSRTPTQGGRVGKKKNQRTKLSSAKTHLIPFAKWMKKKKKKFLPSGVGKNWKKV